MKDNDLVDDKIVISLGPNKPVYIDTLKKDSAWLASHALLQQSVASLQGFRVFQHRVGVWAAEVRGGLRQGHA